MTQNYMQCLNASGRKRYILFPPCHLGQRPSHDKSDISGEGSMFLEQEVYNGEK